MTAQIGEILILNGKKCSIAGTPKIPENCDFIEKIDITQDEKYLRSIISSTACWRRYLGTWEIKENKLYLVDVEGALNKKNKEPVFADWYSGIIKIPQGELLKYIHMGFLSVYEEEIQITIENGIVQTSEIISNRNK
ncbi:MAG: hypothetical protein WCT77_03780 [Bacteroidota bacterium]|jgi:hypothetical protein